MKIYFNADEIFEMAEEIERQGAQFYRKASVLFDEPEIEQMLTSLSGMEIGHEKLFSSMRSRILSDTYKGYDPDEMAASYIKAFTDGKVFDVKKNMCDALTDKSTLRDVLGMAIEAEKNSIAFYTGLKLLVPEALGRETVEKIIVEEMRHLVSLTDKLTSFC
jgi:rubrerythrin